MKLRNLLGLGAIGGFAYAHWKRGGQLSLDSFKQTARELIQGAKHRAKDIRAQAEDKLHEVQEGIHEGVEAGGSEGQVQGGFAEDVTTYGGSSDFRQNR
jgi:hypothetical protein